MHPNLIRINNECFESFRWCGANYAGLAFGGLVLAGILMNHFSLFEANRQIEALIESVVAGSGILGILIVSMFCTFGPTRRACVSRLAGKEDEYRDPETKFLPVNGSKFESLYQGVLKPFEDARFALTEGAFILSLIGPVTTVIAGYCALYLLAGVPHAVMSDAPISEKLWGIPLMLVFPALLANLARVTVREYWINASRVKI